MAREEQPIIIKKIYNTGGHHGGSWKVAFADFMTAMMAFFLVMWLLNQSDEVKKQVASYFSGPSVLEHQLSTYGAKLTLEKLFLDFTQEPLGTLQKLMQPADFTPNLIAMGNEELIIQQIASELGMVAKDVSLSQDTINIEIYDYLLFQVGKANISSQFSEIMERVKTLSRGLENAVLFIDSEIFIETLPEKDVSSAEKVALQRAYILKKYVEAGLESETVEVKVSTSVRKAEVLPPSGKPAGRILFSMQQKSKLDTGVEFPKISNAKEPEKVSRRVYESIVRKLEEQKKKK